MKVKKMNEKERNEKEINNIKKDIKRNFSHVCEYIPWLFVLFGFSIFTGILLWLSGIEYLKALLGLYVFVSITVFVLLTYYLIKKQVKRERAFKSYILNADTRNKEKLEKYCSKSEIKILDLIDDEFKKKDKKIDKASKLLEEYEDYVEVWAHETKLPLSLLTLLLDNQREKLQENVAFKLDYIRNKIQDNISQMLFFYRIKSEKRDFLFEDVDLKELIEEVLIDYSPLYKEKNFIIESNNINGEVYTDKRGLQFILSQIIANSIKYSRENPTLHINVGNYKNGKKYISIKDNGCGVKQCDLPHIFDKGFTGDSGDKRVKSTGMGLYLAKQLLNSLKIEVEIKTEWENGFEIILFF